MEVKVLFYEDEKIGEMNELQLGLILISTLDVVIEISLVLPIQMKMEQYDIVSFQFLVHISVPPNFWTCSGMDRSIFFLFV